MPLVEELRRGDNFIQSVTKSSLEGTTGEIFTAKISETGEEVIVKEIPFDDQNKKDMILSREVAILSNLKNDNIVKFHGFSVMEDRIRLVMEFLKGGDLEKAYQKSLNQKQKVQILLNVARGLKFAHQLGVMHRDIKPQNIYLDKEPGSGLDFVAKIGDFGVSRLGEDNSTKITGIAGTCIYKAPEHLSGDDCDLKIDIYSFAIMAHEILSGQVPYSDKKNSKMNQTRLAKKIKDGLRPDECFPFPEDTNKDLIDLIKRNWDAKAVNRMDAGELVENLEKIFNSI